MRDLKIALFQIHQFWEDPNKNFDHINDLLKTLEPCDLIILPEMFNTGFSMNIDSCSENWNASKSLDYLKDISTIKGVAIYTSLIIEENNKYFNRGVFISDGKVVANYDKKQLFSFAKEDSYFTSGDKTTIVTLFGWRILLQICFDLRFPEVGRNSVVDNTYEYDLAIYTANWPKQRISHWDSLLKARAIENQAFVIGVNRVGSDGKGIEYNGSSQSVSPNGDVQITLKDKERILYQTISYDELIDFRTKLPFLKERRH